ncbi:MAG: glycosyltransferase family 2 protein [Candidatus Bathyarchaeia archaeon]|jgi:glycosyltransferase involved in cell wall biosynthesis
MKVSVVIPTYNRAKDLSVLLDCILKQTTLPLEIIIVDDNTPDNSINDVFNSYKLQFGKLDCDLKYARNVRENSASISRNVGLRLASGEVFMFFDDDMFLFDDYIEKIIDVFKIHPEALGVQGWIQSSGISNKRQNLPFMILHKIFLLGQATRDSCNLFSYPAILTKIINCQALCGGAMALRKEVFKEFLFDENLKKHSHMEDDLFSYSVYQKYPDSLFITPYAKCIHKHSSAGRVVGKQTDRTKNAYRRYVLVKLFGKKGNILYFWQRTGLVLEANIITIGKKIKNRT